MVQARAEKNALHELGYKIFLDRYAQKDMKRTTLKVGDTVIVVVDANTGQREIGAITAMDLPRVTVQDRKSTRLNSSHVKISYAVFCLKKKKKKYITCLQ